MKKKKNENAAALEQLFIDQRERAAKEQIQESRRQYDAALKRIEDLETLLGFRRTLSGDVRVPKLKRRGTKAGKHEATAVLQWSDWHVEEKVDPDVVEGFNGYDLDTAAKRAENCFNNGMRLIELWRSWPMKIPYLVIHLGGDFMTGYLHEEFEEENPLSPFEAARYARNLVREGIEHYIDFGDFDHVVIVASKGNHGRNTKRIRYSTGWKNSFEFNMYLDLYDTYEHNSRVTFIPHKSARHMINVYDFPCRFGHGDDFRYAGGVGGKVIPAKKAVHRWNKKARAYIDFFGHHHEFEPAWGYYVSNGSLIGLNAYGDSKFTYQEPMQACSLIDKDRGLIAVEPIFVDRRDEK